VHPLQVLDDFPIEEHDLPVSLIATPNEVLEVKRPPRPPRGIDWDLLPEAALQEMPVLAELRELKRLRR
jgi:5-formyltetrahydrofolate cyclo-ligase